MEDSSLAGTRLPTEQPGQRACGGQEPCGDRSRQHWAAPNAQCKEPVRLVRAKFSALLAARQLLAVPSPGSGEATAF